MVNNSKYVVLDVETNGLSPYEHDLLSISIYKPDDQKLYNKFLPLEKSNTVYTTKFNGITADMLKGTSHLTQKELDALIEEFDIKNRIVLTFGTIDKRFLRHYFQEKNLNGFDCFNFFNYKENIFSSSFQSGNITKDNLCRIYGISNVQDVHSGMNDCILEWKLFEKMNMKKLIVIKNNVYEYHEDYIIPVSYATNFKRLRKQLSLPKVAVSLVPELRYDLSHTSLFRFDKNISGIAIEHLINSTLSVCEIDSTKQLFENISKLKYIGTLPKTEDEIFVTKNNDGTLTQADGKYKELLDLVNKVSISIKKQIQQFLSLIKTEIFKEEEIFSQELVINQKYNLLALCDLSNKNAVVEIKATKEVNTNEIALQLYIESNERPIFLLYIDWSNKSINLDKIVFSFDEDADVVITKNKEILIQKEQQRLQRSHFDKKELELILYNGQKSNSKFKCNKCSRTFTMKNPLNFDNCYFLQCPYCSPSDFPRYDCTKDHLRKSRLQELYWKSKKLQNIGVQNWVLKEEVYVKCRKCSYEWCDNITNILLDACPKCKTVN